MILSAEASEATGASIRGRAGASATSPPAAPERTRVVTPLNTLIRPQPWVNWLIVALATCTLGGIAHLGWSIDHSDSGLKAILGLRAGRLCQLFSATCLLAVTQLSLVILWYRTHSRKDFHGRYRIWIWSSLTWVVLFSAAASGWHIRATRWLLTQIPGQLGAFVDVVWLLPATILVGSTCRLLSKEMARTPVNRWLLRGAAGLAGAVAVLHLSPGMLPQSYGPEVLQVASALWPLLVASALLHHARYVIHVSNEAAPQQKRAGRLRPILRQVWGEVLTLGPSQATLARSLAPKRLASTLLRIGRVVGSLVATVGKAILRMTRRRNEASVRRESRLARRNEAASLPVASSASESRVKSGGKTTAKTVKSA